MKPILVSLTIAAVLIPALLLPAGMPLDNGLTACAYAGEMSVVEVALMDLNLEDLMKIEVVSANRGIKSISQVPENMVVITAYDMELMNAHTLADVLRTVNGVQLSTYMGSPGTASLATIQGSDLRHVTVIIDGIVINELADNIAIIGSIPVQNIEKVEIIKGPASSVWGSSLGGVINVITKSGSLNSKPSGTISASYGEKNTQDFRADVSGGSDNLAYYFYAGRLHTDGLMAFQRAFSDNLYTKLSYKLAGNTDVKFTLSYNRASDEEGNFPLYDDTYNKNSTDSLLATASLSTYINKDLQADFSLRTASRNINYIRTIYSTGANNYGWKEENRKSGASVKLLWDQPNNKVVIGADYDNLALTSASYTNGSQAENKWAIFANDTITLGKLSVTPGIRVDSSEMLNSFISPSLGITYALGQKTILRLSASRGFSEPTVSYKSADSEFYRHNADLKPEEVWSYQAGAETSVLEYLWLKVTAFRHEIKDGMTFQVLDTNTWTWTYVNTDKLRRQGAEIELRTLPFYNITLSADASFIEATNMTTGEDVKDNPTNTYSVALQYDDRKSLKGLIKGYYIWWNGEDGSYLGKYSSMVFDVNVIKTLCRNKDTALELYLAGHNIFNGSQYWTVEYANAPRWFEAGVKYKF